jgi:polyphosphate:AMP phosphotransferase
MAQRSAIDRARSALHLRILALQKRASEKHRAVMILIGGNDRLGASELANQLHEWFDARFVRLCAPDLHSAEVTQKPFLWPYWNQVPPQGQLLIVVGDWVTRTALSAAQGELSGESLRKRIKGIKNFEETLADNHVILCKIWIDTPGKSLKKRLREAKKSDASDWVVTVDDEILTKSKGHDVAKQIRSSSSGKGLVWKSINGTDPKHRDLLAGRSIVQQITAGLRRQPTKVRKANGRPHGLLESATKTEPLTKKEYSQQMAKLQNRFGRLSRLAAKRGISTIIALEGVDAAGKGGVIRRLVAKADAAHYQVHPTSAPTIEEKNRHYLWRFWNKIPTAGHLAIFDRSWYGRVMVERVEGFARTDEWSRAYSEINHFETQLAEAGDVVLKFWINISKEEQLNRFRSREESPHKRHKMTKEDYRNRKNWDLNQRAAEDMIARTDTPHAPWHVIPGNDKRHARIMVLKAVCRALSDRLD